MEDGKRVLAAQIPQEEVPRLYDGLAKHYDAWARLTETKARRRALRAAAIRDGESVLEVAVGTGLTFLELAKTNPTGKTVGIDISEGMLTRAKRRLAQAGLPNASLSVGSAFAIEAQDASFDVVLNSYMFDLVAEEQWPEALAEYWRVLKPGGRLVLVNMTRGEKPGSGVFDWLYSRSPRLMGGCRGVRMVKPLEDAGFIVRSRRYVQQMLFPSEVILAVKSGEGEGAV